MHPIVILGSSFAALTAVKKLRKSGCTDPISLIAPRPVLFYYPSLIWVPAGKRTEQSLTIPLENFFSRHKVTYQQATVTGLDPQARLVKTDTGDIPFDSLIIASGGRFIKKLPGIEHTYLPCSNYADIHTYSERLKDLNGGTLAFGFTANPNEPAAVRGGPVFEFMFGIDTLLRQQGRRNRFRIVFFNPSTSPGQRLGEQAVTALLTRMAQCGIETHLGHKMKGFAANKVLTEGGEIESDLTLFMPGMTGPAWAEASGLPLSAGGFIQANEHCKVTGFDALYVAGDCGSYPGPDWLPKQAHVADLQAVAAVKNLLLEKRNQPPKYKFKSELVCIVDTLNKGMLVYRDERRVRLLPPSHMLHWAKVAFEYWYIRGYR
jgi:sulfide:quinone oxidoreductase